MTLSSQDYLKMKVVKIYHNFDLAKKHNEEHKDEHNKEIVNKKIPQYISQHGNAWNTVNASSFLNTPFALPDEINLSRYVILINKPIHNM